MLTTGDSYLLPLIGEAGSEDLINSLSVTLPVGQLTQTRICSGGKKNYYLHFPLTSLYYITATSPSPYKVGKPDINAFIHSFFTIFNNTFLLH